MTNWINNLSKKIVVPFSLYPLKHNIVIPMKYVNKIKWNVRKQNCNFSQTVISVLLIYILYLVICVNKNQKKIKVTRNYQNIKFTKNKNKSSEYKPIILTKLNKNYKFCCDIKLALSILKNFKIYLSWLIK